MSTTRWSSLRVAPPAAWTDMPWMTVVGVVDDVRITNLEASAPPILYIPYEQNSLVAAGTFVVRKPGTRAKFRADLLRQLPFDTPVALCDGRDMLRLEMEHPFGTEPPRPDGVPNE